MKLNVISLDMTLDFLILETMVWSGWSEVTMWFLFVISDILSENGWEWLRVSQTIRHGDSIRDHGPSDPRWNARSLVCLKETLSEVFIFQYSVTEVTSDLRQVVFENEREREYR